MPQNNDAPVLEKGSFLHRSKSCELDQEPIPSQIQRLIDATHDLTAHPLPLSNMLPTDSRAVLCNALSDKMLYNGFPDGSVVSWAWGLHTCAEWRRYDHDHSVRCIAAASDGAYVSGDDGGRICYHRADTTLEDMCQSVEIPFLRGCKVQEQGRIGIVAVSADMSTGRDMFGRSFRVKWSGEDNLDEVSEKEALESWTHYFVVSSVVLTKGPKPGTRLVIAGTNNGILFGYVFNDDKDAGSSSASSRGSLAFAFSPFYPVLHLDDETLNNPELLKAVPLDGPPFTALAMSCDEEGILVCGTGRAMSSNSKRKKMSAQPQLLRIDMSECFAQGSEGKMLNSTSFPVMNSMKLGDLATSVRLCAGYSKAAFCVRDQDVVLAR